MGDFVPEAEAKKRLCPESFSREVAGVPCKGAACMAWRTAWEQRNFPVGMEPPELEGWVKDGPPRGGDGAVTNRQSWKRPVGFCGLAGRPFDS